MKGSLKNNFLDKITEPSTRSPQSHMTRLPHGNAMLLIPLIVGL